ncbi:LysE family translocator [Tepidamorphus sp. 3E244]|uniref:LysE family translocator n=1 Tax=Tepidamorphus sp. 3E244 TaxID=3385498 RepID=UPI0038FCB46A
MTLPGFLPEAATLAAYTVAVVVLAITPGPDLTLFLGQTISGGRKAGFAALAGACTGLIVHSSVAAVGLSALLAASPKAFLVLKWVGAAYLAWLAYDALRNGSGLTRDPATVRERGIRRAYIKGLMIDLLNPKIILFFVTFLPQFVSVNDPDAGGKLFFLGLWYIVFSLPCVIPIILTAERIAGWLKGSQRATRLFDYVFAGVMGGFAMKLLMTQTR